MITKGEQYVDQGQSLLRTTTPRSRHPQPHASRALRAAGLGEVGRLRRMRRDRFVTRLQPSGVGNYMLDVRFDDGFLANGFEANLAAPTAAEQSNSDLPNRAGRLR